MQTYNWDTVTKEKMNPLLVRQVIHSEKMTVARLEMSKGCLVPEHSHHNEQISTIAQGRVRFVLGGKEVVVGAGQVLRIPPHVPHSAEALEDAIGVDLFTPPREDWIRGDDAYMRK
jgi:quercetin dioxygenase-like cupin family protein